MNKRTIFIICTLVGASALIFGWQGSRHTSDQPEKSEKPRENQNSSSTKAAESINSDTSANNLGPQSQVSPPYLRDIIQHRYGDEARKAITAMGEFLKTWNPVGRTTGEIKSVFGNPSLEKKDSIQYKFDTGLNGCIYVFVINQGKVTAIELISM